MEMDREKLIKDIERQMSEPTSEYVVLWFSEAEYVLELLKEQEAVYPSWQNGKMYCGHCGSKFPPRVMMRFCHRCGVPIKLKVGEVNETPMA